MESVCTRTCLEKCTVLAALGEVVGYDLMLAQDVVDTVANELHVPAQCKTGGPVASRKPNRREVCGMYYSPDLAAGVRAATAVLQYLAAEPPTLPEPQV